MKKTKWIISLVLALVMLLGTLPAFATEENTSSTDAVPEETVTGVTESGETVDETAEETVTEEQKEETGTEETTESVTATGTEEKKEDENATPKLAGKSTDKCSSPDAKNGKHSTMPAGKGTSFNTTHHWYTCTYCGEVVGEEHTLSDWKQEKPDSFNEETSEEITGTHTPYCSVCRKKYNEQEHNYPAEYDANEEKTCADCGKVRQRPHMHIYAEKWSSNAYQHWHACEATFGLRGTTFCKYDAIHKEVCTPEEHLAQNEDGHDAFRQGGGTCEKCGLTQTVFSKAQELGITECEFDENGYCAYCGVQVENVSEWGEHTFKDGVCTVCGAKDVVPEERPGNAGVKWVVVIAIAVGGAVAAGLVFMPKKKKEEN